MTDKTINIRNQARRLVSIRCNSGTHCHIPPLQNVEIPAVEVQGNSKVSKLLKSGVLAIPEDGANKKPSTSGAKKKKRNNRRA